jgi:hypothetical protein
MRIALIILAAVSMAFQSSATEPPQLSNAKVVPAIKVIDEAGKIHRVSTADISRMPRQKKGPSLPFSPAEVQSLMMPADCTDAWSASARSISPHCSASCVLAPLLDAMSCHTGTVQQVPNRFPTPASSSTATCRYPLVMLTLACPAASRIE